MSPVSKLVFPLNVFLISGWEVTGAHTPYKMANSSVLRVASESKI